MAISKTFLKILFCPNCKADFYQKSSNIICKDCGNSYTVVNDVPVFVKKEEKQDSQVKKQSAIFDTIYKSYKEYSLDNWRLSYLDRVFRNLIIVQTTTPDFFIDVGVGASGYTTIEIAKHGYMSVGCDISLEACLKAKFFSEKEGVSNNCFFAVCNCEELPFKDESFSKLATIAVLEHVSDDDKAINEILRVLKVGGRFFLTVPNSYKRINPLYWIPFIINDKRVGHLRTYDEERIKELLRKFEIKDFYYTGHAIKLFQYFLNFIIFSRLREKVWWNLEKRDLNNKKSNGIIINAIAVKTS